MIFYGANPRTGGKRLEDLSLYHCLFYAIPGFIGQVLVAEALILNGLVIGGPSQQIGQLAQHVDLFVVDAAEAAYRQVEPEFEFSHTGDVLVSEFR